MRSAERSAFRSTPARTGFCLCVWSIKATACTRRIANHKAVAGKREDGCCEFYPGNRLFARLKPTRFEIGNSGCRARRSMVKIYRRAVLQGTRSAVFAMKSRGSFQNNNQRRTRNAEVANGNDVAAFDLIHRDIREI